MKYKIVRYYFRGKKRIIQRGLTLEEAQKYCQDPETSSRTCTTATGRRRTRQQGPWFEGYTQE